jgi:hypothetical protein
MEKKNLIVKCLLLKNNDVLVSEIVEVGSELGEPDCKLTNPYKLIEENDNQFLIPWITFSNQNEIMIHSDSILTIVEPTDKIKRLYFELIS